MSILNYKHRKVLKCIVIDIILKMGTTIFYQPEGLVNKFKRKKSLQIHSLSKWIQQFQTKKIEINLQIHQFNSQLYHNSISYTPHQNKYFGYCQCPNQKVKYTSQEKVCINNITSDRKQDGKSYQPINLANCFNKPKTPKISQIQNPNTVRYKIEENNFDDNLNSHLSGSIRDATQVYKSGSIEAMKYRKGTKVMDKLIKLNNNESDQLRFTCRYLNNKKIKSPPYMVMQKYEIINKINEEQERKIAKSIDDSLIKRITPLPHIQRLSITGLNSSYQNVDISLSQSIDSQKMKAFISQR